MHSCVTWPSLEAPAPVSVQRWPSHTGLEPLPRDLLALLRMEKRPCWWCVFLWGSSKANYMVWQRWLTGAVGQRVLIEWNAFGGLRGGQMSTAHRGNEGGKRRGWTDQFPSPAPRIGVPPFVVRHEDNPGIPVCPQHSPRAQPMALESDCLHPIPALLLTPLSSVVPSVKRSI